MTRRTALAVLLLAWAASGCREGPSAPHPSRTTDGEERTAALSARVEELSATTARLAGVVRSEASDGMLAPPEVEARRSAMGEHADAAVRAASAMVLELRALDASPQLLQEDATARRLGGLEEHVEALVTALEAIVAELEAIAPPATATPPVGDTTG